MDTPTLDFAALAQRGPVQKWEKDLLQQHFPRTASQDVSRLERAARMLDKAKDLDAEAIMLSNQALDYCADATETTRLHGMEMARLSRTMLAASEDVHAKAERRFAHADAIREQVLEDVDVAFSLQRLERAQRRAANAASTTIAVQATKELVNA